MIMACNKTLNCPHVGLLMNGEYCQKVVGRPSCRLPINDSSVKSYLHANIMLSDTSSCNNIVNDSHCCAFSNIKQYIHDWVCDLLRAYCQSIFGEPSRHLLIGDPCQGPPAAQR